MRLNYATAPRHAVPARARPRALPVYEVIDLSGVGTLTVNEQRCKDSTASDASTGCTSLRGSGDTHYSQITVIGLHLAVTMSNPFGLPVGAEMIIAESHSDLAF